MGKYRTLQTSFNGGEYDTKLRSRSDIKSYFQGALKMRNFSLLSHGGFVRRYGSALGANLGDNGRLIPFEYSSEEANLIYLKSSGMLDVYDLDGTLLQTLTGGEWTISDLNQVKYEQRGNAIFLAHSRWQTKILRRTSSGTFELEKFEFYTIPGTGRKAQPYSDMNPDKSIEMTVSSNAINTNVTLTSSKAFFVSDHVDTWMELGDDGYGYITAFTSSTSVQYYQLAPPTRDLLTDPIQTDSGDQVMTLTMVEHGFSTGQAINLVGFQGFAGMPTVEVNGAKVVGEIIDSNRFYFDMDETPDASEIGGGAQCRLEYLGPLVDWRVQSFSEVQGWPGVVALHQERLWFAATTEQPDTLFATRVGALNVFDLGDGYPSDSIQVTLDAGRVNEVRHIVSSRHLQVFTNDAEFYVATPESENVTPENITVRKQTPYGSSHVRATEFDGATIFFQGSGRAVREFLFTDREFAYNARNIALLAQHLITDPVDVAAIYGSEERPEKYLFVRNKDGTLAVLHMIREEEMLGWALWDCEGVYKSIAVAHRRIFYSVQRDGEWFLEEFDQTQQNTLDGSESLPATADPLVFGPSNFYANKTVSVIQKGFYEGEFECDASGNITAPGDHWSDVVIGYNFLAEAETMPAVVDLPDGSLVGMPLRLTRCIIDMENTLALHVDGQRLDMRNTLDTAFTQSGVPVNERVEFQLNTVSRQPTVSITQEHPFPCAVYSIMIEVAW